MYCCYRKLGCTPANLIYLINIFLNWASTIVCGIELICITAWSPIWGMYYIVSFVFSVSQIKFGFKSKRICALKLKVYFGYLYLFNVYMPCDQHIFIDDYIDVLSEIFHYCLSHNVQYLVIGGVLKH